MESHPNPAQDRDLEHVMIGGTGRNHVTATTMMKRRAGGRAGGRNCMTSGLAAGNEDGERAGNVLPMTYLVN